MPSIAVPPAAHLLLVVVVAAPIVYAAVGKLMAPSAFLSALPRFQLGLPIRPATAGALGLFELVVGAGTLLVVRWESAAACTATYLAFGLIMRRARRLGADGDCGCFGSLPSRIDDFAVLRNIGLGLAALAIAFGRGLSLLPNYEVSTALAAAALLLVGGAALDTLVFVRGRERG